VLPRPADADPQVVRENACPVFCHPRGNIQRRLAQQWHFTPVFSVVAATTLQPPAPGSMARRVARSESRYAELAGRPAEPRYGAAERP